MKKLAVVGDTSQDLTYELGEKYGIEVIPYYVQMGENHYKDLDEINTDKFYETMGEYEVLSTGTPPVQDVIDKLDFLKSQGYEQVLLIASSEKVTGMYSLYGAVKSNYEGMELYLYETGQIGSSAGLLSIYAGEMNKDGKSVEEIISELDRIRDKAKIFALFRTLKYLVKGGRFNKYKGMLGNLLNVNPLLTMEDKEIVAKEKIRGTKNSLMALAECAKKELKDAKRYRLAIFTGDNDKELVTLRELIKEEIKNAEMYLENGLTAVLGVHAGPKAIGISIIKLD